MVGRIGGCWFLSQERMMVDPNDMKVNWNTLCLKVPRATLQFP